MRAKANLLSRAISKGPDGQFSMLFAISAPIMALYVSGAMDYANTLLPDEPILATAAIAAPAAMIDAVSNAASLTDTPTVAIATRYFGAESPTQTFQAETTHATAIAAANAVVAAAASH